MDWPTHACGPCWRTARKHLVPERTTGSWSWVARARWHRTITVQDGQLTSNFIRSLKEDQNGRIGSAPTMAGCSSMTRAAEGPCHRPSSASPGRAKVTALELGQPGELWVGGLNGVRRYILGSGTVPTIYTVNEGLASDHVKGLFRDRDGAIWVGSTVGVYR